MVRTVRIASYGLFLMTSPPLGFSWKSERLMACVSVTPTLEQAGWSGICIEAHPDYISLLRRNRPNSVIVHAAVGDEDKETVSFYANSRGSFSTLDPSIAGIYPHF